MPGSSPFAVLDAPHCARLWVTIAWGEAAAGVTVDRAATAPLGPGTNRPLRHHRETRRRGDGTSVPRPFHGRAPGGGEDDPDRAGGGAGLPRPLRPRGGRGQAGERGVD